MYELYIEMLSELEKICIKKPEVKYCERTLWDTFVALSSMVVLYGPELQGKFPLLGVSHFCPSLTVQQTCDPFYQFSLLISYELGMKCFLVVIGNPF